MTRNDRMTSPSSDVSQLVERPIFVNTTWLEINHIVTETIPGDEQGQGDTRTLASKHCQVLAFVWVPSKSLLDCITQEIPNSSGTEFPGANFSDPHLSVLE